jgi:Putative beta barrel porin-7 (BBP7)
MLFSPGQTPLTAPGGVLALPGNSGRRDYSAFSVVPEVGCNLGVQLAPRARATIGYGV